MLTQEIVHDQKIQHDTHNAREIRFNCSQGYASMLGAAILRLGLIGFRLFSEI